MNWFRGWYGPAKCKLITLRKSFGSGRGSFNNPAKRTSSRIENPDLFGTHVISQWYLKETVDAGVDDANLHWRCCRREVWPILSRNAGKRPSQGSVHYSNLFEQYVYTVKDRPRRPLIDGCGTISSRRSAGPGGCPATQEEEETKSQRAGVRGRTGEFGGSSLCWTQARTFLTASSPAPRTWASGSATASAAPCTTKAGGFYLYGPGEWLDHLPEGRRGRGGRRQPNLPRALEHAASLGGKKRDPEAGQQKRGPEEGLRN